MHLDFGNILLYLIHGTLFVALALFVASILRPNRPDAEKLATYECGEEPVGSARIQFNNRFYIVGLMFLIFEVEVVLLFPWAVVFQEVGWYAFFVMLVFVSLIFIGFIYELGSGHMQWDKPDPVLPRYIEGQGVVLGQVEAGTEQVGDVTQEMEMVVEETI
ncbi:MAG: NADH-quinone oxidoreductase subunit A [Balneolales bacterium]